MSALASAFKYWRKIHIRTCNAVQPLAKAACHDETAPIEQSEHDVQADESS